MLWVDSANRCATVCPDSCYEKLYLFDLLVTALSNLIVYLITQLRKILIVLQDVCILHGSDHSLEKRSRV